MTERIDSIMVQSYEKELITLIRKLLKGKSIEGIKSNDLLNELIDLVEAGINAYRNEMENVILKELENDVLLEPKDSNIEQQLFNIYKKEISNQFELVIEEYADKLSIPTFFSRHKIPTDSYKDNEEVVRYKYFNLLKIDFDFQPIDEYVKEYIKMDTFLMTRYIESENSHKNVPIEHNSFEGFHNDLYHEEVKIDVVLTDPPYFVKINPNWDNTQSPEQRLEYFKSYLHTLIPIVKKDSVLMIFNDFSNVDIIQNAINEIRDGLASWGEDKTSYKKYGTLEYEISDILYDYDIDLEKMSKEERYNLFDFTVLGFLEWTKANPAAGINPNNKNGAFGNYKNSEYLIVALKNYETNPRKAKFERLIYESREIFSSVNPDSKVRDKDLRIHETIKNSNVLKNLILRFTEEDDLILDSFSGSGAISIACFETGRKSVACERDSYMYKLSVGRYDMVRKLIGKSPYPFNLAFDYENEAKYSKFANGYMYQKYKYLIEEVYTSALEPLTRKQRIEYARKSLTKISKKNDHKSFSLDKLTSEEISFLLGFGKDYLHSKHFQFLYGVSRLNPMELFKAFNDNGYIQELEKELEENGSNIELLNKIDEAKANGKFLIDKAVRFTEMIHNLFGYDIDHLLTLFKDQKALANFKNKTKIQKFEAYSRYSEYLLEVIEVLLIFEDKAQNFLATREDYSSKEFQTAKYYYKLLTKLLTFFLFTDNNLGGTYDDEIVSLPKKLILKYSIVIEDESTRLKLYEKLGLEDKEEDNVFRNIVNEFEDIHPSIRNSIEEGLIESLELFSNISVVEEFKLSSINKQLKKLFKHSTALSERTNIIYFIGSIKNVDSLTPTQFEKEITKKLDVKLSDNSKQKESVSETKTETISYKKRKIERIKKVREFLKKDEQINSIAKKLKVSPQTIRNDIKTIEAEDKIKSEDSKES